MEVIKKVYTDLNSPACYSTPAKVYKVAKSIDPNITLKDVEDYLTTVKSYTLHKPRRVAFKRLKTVPVGYMTNLQADLADFQKVAKHNDGYRYLLVTIDVLSRQIFVAPTKSKSSKDMVVAFDKVFAKMPYVPQYLFTDKGVEFQAKEMMAYYKKKDVQKHVAQSPDVKAAIAERCIRTIKMRLYKYFTENQSLRWVDVIDSIVDALNHSMHRTIKMRPADVNLANAEELWDRMYGDLYKPKPKSPKYEVGDTVRISKEKKAFQKGYVPQFSREIFKVDAVKTSKDPTNYRLVDEKGEEIVGKFYNEEFSKAVPETRPTYEIEKVLQTRMRAGRPEYLVKYKGHTNTMWVRKS
jgi:hypothetical protein